MTDHSTRCYRTGKRPTSYRPSSRFGANTSHPAFAALFEQHLAEINALAENPAAPTFDNTVASFDAGRR